MEQRVLSRLRNYFQVGSEDWTDVTFSGQRIRWTKDPQTGSYIEISQEKAIEEPEEIPVERSKKKDLHCAPATHTKYRSLVGCCKFSKCASMTVFPAIGDVKALKKLTRQLKSQPVRLTGPLRILGFPVPLTGTTRMAFSQRGITVVLAESRERSSGDGMVYGSLIDNELQKDKMGCALNFRGGVVLFHINVVVHVNSFVDCGWTYLVKLHIFT